MAAVLEEALDLTKVLPLPPSRPGGGGAAAAGGGAGGRRQPALCGGQRDVHPALPGARCVGAAGRRAPLAHARLPQRLRPRRCSPPTGLPVRSAVCWLGLGLDPAFQLPELLLRMRPPEGLHPHCPMAGLAEPWLATRMRGTLSGLQPRCCKYVWGGCACAVGVAGLGRQSRTSTPACNSADSVSGAMQRM